MKGSHLSPPRMCAGVGEVFGMAWHGMVWDGLGLTIPRGSLVLTIGNSSLTAHKLRGLKSCTSVS